MAMRSAPLALVAALGAWILAGAPPTARGQSPVSPPGGLTELALRFAEGDFRAPVLCAIDGTAHRGLRHVRVSRGARDAHRPLDRIAFRDLEVPPGTRCHDELGQDEPNVVGSVVISFEGRSRPDTARFDFDEALRRHGGFTYPIVSSALRVGPSGEAPEALPLVDFKGGTAELTVVKRGTDSFRRLADFGARRKLQLFLAAQDGTRLAFDLVQVDGP
jgi:hypothetical protein